LSHKALGASRPPDRFHRHRLWRTVAAAAVSLMAALAGVAGLTAAPASASTTAATMSPQLMEVSFAAAVNYERVRRGIAPVGDLGGLNNLARGWSGYMDGLGALTHDTMLMTGVRWVLPGSPSAGEIVGMAYTVEQVHDAWMASPVHRSIMLNPAYRWVGVGVSIGPGGSIWVTERFAG